jgi:hypothetical protein
VGETLEHWHQRALVGYPRLQRACCYFPVVPPSRKETGGFCCLSSSLSSPAFPSIGTHFPFSLRLSTRLPLPPPSSIDKLASSPSGYFAIQQTCANGRYLFGPTLALVPFRPGASSRSHHHIRHPRSLDPNAYQQPSSRSSISKKPTSTTSGDPSFDADAIASRIHLHCCVLSPSALTLSTAPGLSSEFVFGVAPSLLAGRVGAEFLTHKRTRQASSPP